MSDMYPVREHSANKFAPLQLLRRMYFIIATYVHKENEIIARTAAYYFAASKLKQ